MDIDDGSIVKWEVSSLNPAELTVTKAGQSQTVTLSGNSALAEPVVIEDTAPAYIIAHGPLAYWDYYLTNYDDDGNLRVEPAKTTFSLSDDVVSDVPAFYSPDAELCEGDGFGEVKGEAVIMFNYNTDAEKAWFDAIPDNQAQTVQLVSYDGNKTTFNDSLTYVKAAGISHGGGSVGRITVALGHENFRTNGRYYIRIRSAGHDTALVPTHVVNEQAPTLKLSGSGTVQSGQNVSFEIENMTYGITNPVYGEDLSGRILVQRADRVPHLRGDGGVVRPFQNAGRARLLFLRRRGKAGKRVFRDRQVHRLQAVLFQMPAEMY